MAFVEVQDGAIWERALLELPNNHILQSFAWGEFKSRHGWGVRRLLWRGETGPRAAAQILTRRMGPFRMAYVPKGPVLDYKDTTLLEEVLAALEKVAHAAGAIFIKLDPDWPEGEEAVRERLTRRGWRRGEEVQFRNTLLVDLEPGEEKILAAMKSKTRYNVRLAGRRGVEVVPTGEGELALFYRMYQETSRRNRFVIRPFDYYRDLWESFLREGLARFFLARYQGEVLAGLILFRYGTRAWYMYGASIAKHRNLMPNNALQWEAMRWAKGEGVKSYDLWGAPEPGEADPMAGVYRFKAGFGGRLVRHIGAHDYPVSAPLYWLYGQVIPRTLALLRTGDPARRGLPAGPS